MKHIEFLGSSPLRNERYYEVWEVLIAVKKRKRLDYSKHDIDIEEDFVTKTEYICTCKDCSIKQIPNGKEPRCKYVRELKRYLGDED